MYIIIGALLIIIVFVLLTKYYPKTTENFGSDTGQFCLDCKNKNLNQCVNCFNCGYFVDNYGNHGCIPGDHKGPYNREEALIWYYGDPWSRVLQSPIDKCYNGKKDNCRPKNSLVDL